MKKGQFTAIIILLIIITICLITLTLINVLGSLKAMEIIGDFESEVNAFMNYF